MEPIQKSTAPKRHPLQFPTKSDKNQPKIIKEAKQVEPVKPAKEEKINVKPHTDPLTAINAKKQEKQIGNELVSEASKQADLLQSKKVESIPPQVKSQPKVEVIPVKIEETKQEIPIKVQTKPKQEIAPKHQEKKPEKRQHKDILSLVSKPKQPIKPSDPITTIKTEILQKKQVKAEKEVIQTKPVPVEPKKQVKEVNYPQIGERVEQNKPQKHPVHISINESSQRGSGLLKSTYYHINGEDDHGHFTVNRKYEEFEALNNILHERWPGCFLPALSKESEGKKEAEKDRHLRAILASFLLGLSYSPHMYYREEVQLFLRSPDLDASEMFRKMPPLKTKDVISRFRSSFGELLDQPSTPAHAATITSFIAALRKVINNLGTLSLKALTLGEAYEAYHLSFGKFSKVHKAYEQLCLSEYQEIGGQRAIIMRDAENRLEKLQELTKHNPFLKLHSFLSNQVRDAQAFLEVIIASELFVLRKEDLQREIKELQGEIESVMLGHKSLKTMTTRRPKEEVQAELEQRQKRLNEEKETMVEMYTILQILLATRSIQEFRSFKRDNYHSILQQWAQVTQKSSPQVSAVWQFIAQDSRTQFKQ